MDYPKTVSREAKLKAEKERADKAERELQVAKNTLRDQFAMAAMTGFNREMVAYDWGDDVLKTAAIMAYRVADAMLEAR